MGTEDSIKKLKRKKSSQLAQKAIQANMKMKAKIKKKSSVDIANKAEAEMFELLPNIQADEPHTSSGEKKTSKSSRNIKMKNTKKIGARAEDVVNPQSDKAGDRVSDEKNVGSELAENKLQEGRKKRKDAKSVKMVDEHNENEGVYGQGNGKSKKAGKTKKKSRSVENKIPPDNFLESREDTQDDVYQMPSGDEDYSKGMQKWITQYHRSRPWLQLLQEKIDDFILAHEAKEEEARVERESQAAEGGWTVVVHHKGRKKTIDAESGIAMGSVAKAAVEDKLANKKTKEVGLDFYRFQKREAHRNEIMMLQSKFEQDKKRIQQLRAARKFRPY